MPSPLRAWSIAVLLPVLLAPGCGKIGDPLPPFLSIPESTDAFTVEQVGYELYFAWTNPSRNVDQSASVDLNRAVILENLAVVAEVVVSGPGEGQSLVLPARELVGSTLQYTIHFETTRGRVSAPSPQAQVMVIEVPGPGSGIRAEVDQNRVTLEWEPPQNGADITDGYYIYRSGERISGEGDALVTVPRFEDTGYRVGETYIYTVVPVREGVSGLVAGLPFEAVSVTALDGKPPSAPTGLSLIPFEGGVFVRWQSNPESDVVRYGVFRRDDPSGDFRRVSSDGQATNAFQDPEYQSGFEYAVTASDRSGNESPISISIVE
jgi:hypothetical protein